MEGASCRTEPSPVQLLTGIVNDAKELVRHELALATYDIREDLRKTKRAMPLLGIAIGVAILGGLLLILMLVHLLHVLAEFPCGHAMGSLVVYWPSVEPCCSSSARTPLLASTWCLPKRWKR